MTVKRIALLLLVVFALVAAGAYAYASRYPALAAIEPPDPASFDPALVELGETMAGFGNCETCHTRVGGARLAGGLGLPTPFGTVYSTNITPDPETGIGSWSEAAFVRAMREGVDREGHFLYPAFPYDFFTRTTDEDLSAIYAYLMTRDPVVEPRTQNALRFPFDQRLLLAGWNRLFLDPGPREPDPDQDEEWNRGAYLVEGLGHCGACHSLRNAFGAAARDGDGVYAGGLAEGWYVPPLDDSTPAPIPWTLNALVNYLIDGRDDHHGIAAGPMTAVTNDLYEQSEDDVFAIAAYLMSLKGGEPENVEAVVEEVTAYAESVRWGADAAVPAGRGAEVFEAQCAQCHKAGAQIPPLAFSTVVNAPDAVNLIRIVFEGIHAPHGSPGQSMPARAIQIPDGDMVALAEFVRARFSQRPPWTGVEAAVAEARDNLAGH